MQREQTHADLLEQQRRHFNSIAKRYHDARQNRNLQRLKDLIWGSALTCLQHMDGRPLKVLEAMCGFGEGHQIATTLSPEIEYHGFDYSDEVVAAVNETHPGWDVWQADVTRVELEANSYDVVIVIGGLHHVPYHAQESVVRLTSALRPGGVFISFEPTHGNPLSGKVREFIYKRNSLFDEQTERAFGVDELCGLFESAGLELRDLCFPGLLAYVLFYNPDAFPVLNRGGPWLVNTAFAMDRLLYRTAVGRWLSFATLSIWERPD